MTTNTHVDGVLDALSRCADTDFEDASLQLLEAMGYPDKYGKAGDSSAPEAFVQEFAADGPGTVSERAFLDQVTSVRIVNQLTEEEVEALIGRQPTLLDMSDIDASNARSFLFASVELVGDSYTRGQYALFTREINKRFDIPTVVLFRAASGRITFAFVNRRVNKREAERDVLGTVSLIREINPRKPHRAHQDILRELSLDERLKWMESRDKPKNFDGLLAAWLNALDTEELNKRFYGDLFDWFARATKQAKFPAAGAKVLPTEEHIIRLITRMLFVWFVKEKRLIAEDLFTEAQVGRLLRNYDRDGGDSYYRAVLQNLFFATLNTEIDLRGFSSRAQRTHRDFSRYRYKSEIADAARLFQLFRKTPFINGGLFDCLDSEAATGDGGWRIDFFTDNIIDPRRAEYGLLSIPNRLFFGDDGLINLFDRYKFTVEENTPAEQEVALDPELLGKVFENLLAAYSPETRETARKQTGSYYTPRAVVDYMVDEALVASLSESVQPHDMDKEYLHDRLRYLLDYADAFADADTLFTDSEREAIVLAIAEVKILDPAVGSGAFPMSMLHKLTLALRRLDEHNELWEALQKKMATERVTAAFDTSDPQEREDELKEISDTFEKYRESDFGRKLYLIQNSIYGVDIQPVATQIAKLRFFISLAIEQRPDSRADNLGIRPLPNLETRFVAANTLLGLKDADRQLSLGHTDEVRRLQDALNSNRERHYHANSRSKKQALIRQNKDLRLELAEVLRDADFDAGDASKIADWDPFDQNTTADWFDAEYMFGVKDGFDVVIGNPPYIESRNSLLSGEMKDAYLTQIVSDWGETLPRGSDLLIYFLARGPKLLHDSGCGYLITQNAWLTTDYGKKFQDFSLDKFSFHKIIDTSAKFFSDSNGPQINAVIAVFGKQMHDNITYEVVDERMRTTLEKTITTRQAMKWGHVAVMPPFFIKMLSQMTKRNGSKNAITFGQGLNFPLKELNQIGSSESVIAKDVQFVATSADGKIRANRISANRMGRVPALIMPRGIGNRYYCTFNACKAFSYSGVELYLTDALWGSDLHYCLWAYLNSSLAWLFREVTGRRNLGGGLLKAEATDMKTFPTNFDFDFAVEAKAVFNVLKDRTPLPVAQEILTDEHLTLDQMVFDFFGFPDMQDDVRNELLKQVAFRMNRSTQ